MKAYAARNYYRGEAAERYNAVRTSGTAARRRWNRELSIVETIVRSFPAGSRVLDLPCGTGRFHPLLVKHGCDLVGGDISLDMMRQARLAPYRGARRSVLVSCDAERLPFRDRSFDYVLCMRFFNLLPPETAAAVLREASRISRRAVIVQVRFQGQNPLLRIIPDLKRSAGRLMRGQPPAACASAHIHPPVVNKRYPLPAFEKFLAMVERAGLAIDQMYDAGRILEPDPLRICSLVHR